MWAGVLFGWLVIWWSALRAGAVVWPRCCSAGRGLKTDALLAGTLTASEAAAACEDITDNAWAPRVFLPARGQLLERGRVPPHWRAAWAALPACTTLRVLPEHSATYALLANNASLWERAGRTLPATQYCADVSGALVCADERDAPPPPLKCCGEAHVLAAADGARCVPEDAPVAAAAVSAALGGARLAFGWPGCGAGSTYAARGRLVAAALRTDGALELGGTRLAAGAWCAEAVLGGGAEDARVLACAEDERRCPGAQVAGEEGTWSRHTLYGAGLAVGALFLAATLAASCARPAAPHALHWRCQTQYVAALMLGDALLAATQLAGDRVPPALCRTLAVCMHFLFLSAFFWLNTMCFNIWWTFRDFRPTSLERGQELWRLRVYLVYAWGGPLALAGTAALLDALPAAAAEGLLRPRFGECRCWFYGDSEILVYFFGPVGVLLLVNLALFVSTARQLTCGLWRRDEVKSTSERAALGRVCAKLVVVMGVTWGADVVSWAAGGPEYVWYATDLLNALQGVLIFLVVGCRRHAWAALRRALSSWRGRGGGGAGGGGTRGLNSSTHLPSCGESLTNTTAAPVAAAPAAPAKIPMETVC